MRIRGEFEFERIRANSNLHPYHNIQPHKPQRAVGPFAVHVTPYGIDHSRCEHHDPPCSTPCTSPLRQPLPAPTITGNMYLGTVPGDPGIYILLNRSREHAIPLHGVESLALGPPPPKHQQQHIPGDKRMQAPDGGKKAHQRALAHITVQPAAHLPKDFGTERHIVLEGQAHHIITAALYTLAAFHDHGILPDDTWREVQRKTLDRDYRRRVRARLLEIRDPLRQRWDDLWLRHLDPWLLPSHLPHTCGLCGECDTVSSAASTRANRCARCAQVAACPWPEPPAGPRRRTEEEALHRRIEGAHAPSHERAGPAGAALLWIHMHLWDPTSVAHLSHVFAP